MSLLLNNEQKVTLTLQPLTAGGNPGKIDGTPSWSVSDTSIIVLNVAADGLSAVATSGSVGTATVSVSATVGSNSLSATLDISVQAAEATVLNIVAGTPELK